MDYTSPEDHIKTYLQIAEGYILMEEAKRQSVLIFFNFGKFMKWVPRSLTYA